MKNRNPLATQTLLEKKTQYLRDCENNVLAYKSNGKTVPLSAVSVSKVEFIGGLWRVQDRQKFKIIKIRDKDMILGPRIEHNEKTFFEYYYTTDLSYNCYGPFMMNFDMVAAKYTTDKGEYWAYGKSIAAARAFLGIRLYDEYMDLIHTVACKKTLQNTGK